MKSNLGSRLKAVLQVLFKLAIWLGIGLLSAGLTVFFLVGTSNSTALGLAIAGVVLIGLWVLGLGWSGDSNQLAFWQRRSTQIRSNAVVSTVSVLVILGLLNFVAARYGQQADLTETQLLSLAPETQAVLMRLNQPMTLYVFEPKLDATSQTLLQNFRRQTPNFAYELIDPNADPANAQKFEIKNTDRQKDVYLELPSRQRRTLVQQVSEAQPLSEDKITNAIIRVNSDRSPKVYVLEGHGEASIEPATKSISTMIQTLQDKNFLVEGLNLAQRGKLPDDAAVIVVAGPTKPLFELEVQQLDAYCAQGGSLLIMLDPNTQIGSLEAYLQTWGLGLDNRLAIDASKVGTPLGFGAAAPVVADYNGNAHPITQEFGKGISVYPLARPLEIKEIPGVQALPIALTVAQSWAEANPTEKPVVQNAGDRPGPLPIGVALARPAKLASIVSPSPSPSPSPLPNVSVTASPAITPSPVATATTPPSPQNSPLQLSPNPQEPAKQSRLVVFGNSSFASDTYVGKAPLNGDMFLNSIGWLSQQSGQTLSIRPRTMNSRRLAITGLQNGIVTLVAAIGLPLLGLAAATFAWWRRR